MKNWFKVAGVVLFLAVCSLAAIWWPVYKYHDCRRVGHTKLYCIMDIGK